MAQLLLKPLGEFITSKNLKPQNFGGILLLGLGLLWMSFNWNGETNNADHHHTSPTLSSKATNKVNLESVGNEHFNEVSQQNACERFVLSVATNAETGCGQHDGMILIRYQDDNAEKSTYTVKIDHEQDHEIVVTGQNGNPIVVPNLYPGDYQNIRLIREVDGCESNPISETVSVKTKCESRVASRRMGDQLVLNDCGANRSYDAYIRGVDGVLNPSFDIPNPENVTRVIVELWVEGNNPPSGITFTGSGGASGSSSMNVTGIPVAQSQGSTVGETIYRETFDGNYAQVRTGYDDGTSMAIYVERAISGGSSSIYTSDTELNGRRTT